MELPQIFKDKIYKLLGDSSNDFFMSLEKPSIKAITLNENVLCKEIFMKTADFSPTPIEKVNNGYYVDNFKFGNHLLSHIGAIYSQEPSAMYPVEMLDIKHGDIVLDLCASPGGKSIQILEKLQGTGLLVSNEIVYNRSKILYENLNRMGFKNFAITCNSPKDYEELNIKFDKILVDAPCGGEGMFRKNNFDFNSYHPELIETNAKRQLSILNSIKNLLKDGGRLVYSTCTYDIKENEEVIANFLKDNRNFKIVYKDGYENVTSSGIKIDNIDTDKTYRRYPHLHLGEGQYMAILEKDGEESFDYFGILKAKGYSTISRKDEKVIQDTFKNVADISTLNIYKKEDNFYALPETYINFENLNLLTIGTIIGTRENNTFKINHNFYHTYGELFYNKIELNKEEATKYIHGETINTDSPNGIYVVKYLNAYLGGGKVINGTLKNYYPKDLRI